MACFHTLQRQQNEGEPDKEQAKHQGKSTDGEEHQAGDTRLVSHTASTRHSVPSLMSARTYHNIPYLNTPVCIFLYNPGIVAAYNSSKSISQIAYHPTKLHIDCVCMHLMAQTTT